MHYQQLLLLLLPIYVYEVTCAPPADATSLTTAVPVDPPPPPPPAQQLLRLPRVSFLSTPRKTVKHASAYGGGVAAYVSIRHHSFLPTPRERNAEPQPLLLRMRSYATSVCGLTVLVYEVLSYYCMNSLGSSVSGILH